MVNGQEMNLAELVEKFSSEEKCRAYLEALRWPAPLRASLITSRRTSGVNRRQRRFAINTLLDEPNPPQLNQVLQ